MNSIFLRIYGGMLAVLVLVALLGVGALMHTTPWLLTVAKVVGGAYILYLGVSLLRSKPKTVLEGEKVTDEPVFEQTLLKAFTTGFLTNATNPKATLFFLAIFTTIISASTPLEALVRLPATLNVPASAPDCTTPLLTTEPTLPLPLSAAPLATVTCPPNEA